MELLIFSVLIIYAICGIPYDVDVSTVQKAKHIWTMLLKKIPEAKASYSEGIEVLHLLAESLDSHVLHLKITDAIENRWEVPIENPDSGNKFHPVDMLSMGFKYAESPFGFEILQSSKTLMQMSESKKGALLYSDKYLELGLWFPSQRIMGLGERISEHFELCKKSTRCVYTLWNRDQICTIDEGKEGGKNIYSTQPFYLVQMLDSRRFIGILSYNSNAQDAVIYKYKNREMNVIHKLTGGVIDLYFFYPGSAQEVLQKYHELIGRPTVQPFWSLGYHQSRWGWIQLSQVKETVEKFNSLEIPLDSIWGDIDYMKEFADFTVNSKRYSGFKEFVDILHINGIRYFII